MASLRPHLLLPLLSTLPRLRLRLHPKPPIPTLPSLRLRLLPRRRFLSSAAPAPHAVLGLHQDLESNTSDSELEVEDKESADDVDVDSDDDVVSASPAAARHAVLDSHQDLESNTSDSELEVEDTDSVVDVDVDAVPLVKLESPELSPKEKKELASYAHSLGKKLKSQQVGKSGVTAAVAAAFVETLESKELLKLKVHGSCPGELSEVIKQLEEATGSVAVGQIGRSVILYKPSLSKMKKKEAQSTRKVWRPKSAESSPTFGAEKKWKSSPTFGAAKKWKAKLTESSPTFGAEKWKVRRGEQYQSRHA